ncbi:MAG TPA: PQQ-binding-like beta-propeller repeat protein [Streptosporangiaceae bacterium]|nr:PQQ-binding-like beta-propeller repeat protein [Streptosporangiaceae bacterium]
MTALSLSLPPAAQAQALGHGRHAAAGRQGSGFDWPELHQGPALQGYASNGTVTTANAGHLGVAWATDLYGAALDSPVVAYNATLNETLAYIGTEGGDVIAVNMANGQTVWATWVGSVIRATPVVSNGSVYVGTDTTPRLYRLDATTGAVQCSVAIPRAIEASPVVATPPGGVTSLYFGTNDSPPIVGPTFAVNAATCAIEWEFTGFVHESGSWDPYSYAVDATGEPLVLFGTADADSNVYAVDAVTGKEVWHFAIDNPPPGVYDVGAGVTVSPPGAGNVDGSAYVVSKAGIAYDLDLTTGAKVWSVDFDTPLGGQIDDSFSTAALDGTNLVFGYSKGLVDLNPSTGAIVWGSNDPSSTEVVSSPVISGPAGSEVVADGDLAGEFDVVSLATGAQLFHYQTDGYVTASPAVSGGNILISSSDGFLYDFAVGHTTPATAPTTTITSPSDSSTLPNPNGNLTATGRATTDPATTVAGVEVAVQADGPDGQWWDAATNSWSSGPIANPATLASPGTDSTNWSLSYLVPQGGGTYDVTAYTVSAAGPSDTTASHVGYGVLASTTGPHLKLSTGFVAPASSVTVSGGGFGASTQVTLSLTGTTLATATTTATGALPATKVSIPADEAFGQASLTGTASATNRSATAPIVVTNNWDQFGNDAGHTGLEPNDKTFAHMITPGGGIFLSPAWRYQSGAGVGTATAVANDVAYVANNAGQLTALDVHNGSPIWTWTLPSGAAIHGSPAVDPHAKLVFVGANDGTLNAISTTTGKLAWSTPAAGSTAHVSAPVYGGGDVYVTTTTAGSTTTSTVAAFTEATGAKVWSVSGPAGALTAPALDTSTGTLAVGGPSGAIAYNVKTGTTRWNFAAGAVTAPLALEAGNAYFGSADHNVYAVNEKTGVQTWSYQTPSAVSDAPVLSTEDTPKGALTVFLGSGNGALYAINAATGALDYTQGFTASPIVGLAVVNQVVILEAANGFVGACRTYGPTMIWRHSVTGGITAAPAIVDGTAYVGSGDGDLSAFTGYGRPPA